MYKLYPIIPHMGKAVDSVERLTDGSCIPFAEGNADFRKFKIDLDNGASLNDGENNPMTTEQITAFLSTLP